MTAARAVSSISTRDRIVETALRLFSERGTSAVSMRELADGAGVTVQGVYYHFDSKADLIRAVYRAHGLGGALGDAPTEVAALPDTGPVIEIVTAEAQREFSRLVDERDFLRMMQRDAVLGDEDALEVGAALEAAHRERWVRVIRRATDLAPGVDLDAAADGIATFLWGLFVKYLTSDTVEAKQRIDDFVALLAAALARR